MNAGTYNSGQMQNWPLTTDRIITHASQWHGETEVISVLDTGAYERTNYTRVRDDAARISNAMLSLGIVSGDRVATLAMNSGAHLSAWYAISGIGAICHTLNPRYSDDQLSYIVNHAGDRLLFADGAFAPLVSRLIKVCPTIERVIFLSPQAHPDYYETAGAQRLSDFVAGYSSNCTWGGFGEETAAGLCYTSGTTGPPKGVLYSHRSNFIHTLLSIQPDMFNLSARDTLMPVVPMYHANAWGMTFSAPYVGTKLVLPGSKLDGGSLCRLMQAERVTVAAGVPTIWLAVLDYMKTNDIALPDLRRVIVGGAPLPERVLRAFHEKGIEAVAAWGMTEMSPTGGVSSPVAGVCDWPFDEQVPTRLKTGRAPCGIEMRIVGKDGGAVPHDGQSMGHLQLRGPTVVRRYFGQDYDALTEDGFFDGGDIATIDKFGFMKIADRVKDIIKSGGEWISSLDIENAALTYPGIAVAAVVAKPDPKWDERPVLFLELQPDATVQDGALLSYLGKKLPKWWLPDEIIVVTEMPIGATGKIDKKLLKDQVRPKAS